MSQISLHLEKRLNSKGEANIVVRYYQNGRVMLKTGIAVSPKFWNGNVHRVKASHARSGEINNTLDTLMNELESWRLTAIRDGAPLSVSEFKTRFNARLRGEAVIHSGRNVLEWGDHWVEKKRSVVTSGTVRTWKTMLSHLRKFSELSEKEYFPEDLLKQSFHLSFSEYLNHKVEVNGKKGLRRNTANKVHKNFRNFMRFLLHEGEIEHFPDMSFLKFTEAETYHIALSEDQIQAMEEVKLTGELSQVRSLVRDVFIVGCETGLRFSDYSRLTKNHVDDNGLIRIQAKKTKPKVVVPISPRLERIRDKYNGDFPRYTNNQVFNREIKKVAELAGIDNPVMVVEQRGNKAKEVIKREYEMVASHTARRTFATIHYLKGKSVRVIRSITGHTTDKQFFKYIKINEQVAEEDVKHFFD